MRSMIITIFSIILSAGCAAKVQSNADVASSSSKQQQQNAGSVPDGSGVQNPPLAKISSLQEQVVEYKQRYGLRDPYTKLVDDRGNNYQNLYGVRNFRAVLHGVYYRGGANNVYNKVDGVRNNSNPLPPSGLKNLCEEGFKDAIYLYSTNYASAPKQQACKDYKNVPQVMQYEQITGLSAGNTEKFIAKAYDVIKRKSEGPIYGHCWNGWHASGYVASTMLKQFCGYTDQQALDYWIKNTDGNSTGYDAVKKLVVSFKPLSKYQITAEEKNLICP